MKQRHTTPRAKLALYAVLALFVACGDNLISDPSFDLWCNGKLCKPWKVSGTVTRVKSWHEHDYAVSLGKSAVLSQLSKHDPVECIAFEVIADVSASADVWLEMDFRDDGVSEYKQQIAESHWAKLRYLVKAPTWYDNLRFILRKKGDGRAVLAQIKATPSDECKGDALMLVDRPKGATCEEDTQCETGLCAEVQPLPIFDEPAAVDLRPARVCSECSAAVSCPGSEICGVAKSEVLGGPALASYAACVAKESLEAGSWCLTASECKSQLCSLVGAIAYATCAECTSDDDCTGGQICGVAGNAEGTRRTCVTPGTHTLGELCVVDAECKSGVCNGGSCSECSDEHECKRGAKCGPGIDWVLLEAALCDPGAGNRTHGAACTTDEDCASGTCDEPEPICDSCQGEACEAMGADHCFFVRNLAGTCH